MDLPCQPVCFYANITPERVNVLLLMDMNFLRFGVQVRNILSVIGHTLLVVGWQVVRKMMERSIYVQHLHNYKEL